MEQLIKVQANENGQQVVSAKELYVYLGYDKSHWASWSKKNIENNEFAIENTDYQTFALMANGNETKDFVITVDFAKRLAMMARTDKGEEARLYFIECEKQLSLKTPQTYLEALKALVATEEEKQLLLESNKQLETKVDNLSTAFMNESNWLSILKVSMHNKVSEKVFDWRKLKQASDKMGYEVKKMQSRRFKYQNLYHIDTFRVCYPQYNYNFENN